jgi:hypothetical protein
MSIYSPKDDDEFVIGLKEWIKNNPLQPEDFQKNLEIQSFLQEEARQKALVRNYTMMKCEKCGKVNNIGNHKRWHGDNCGIKKAHSEETKKKISKSLTGRVFSEEHRKKLGDNNRIRYLKKKPHSSSSSNPSQSTIISQQNGQ